MIRLTKRFWHAVRADYLSAVDFLKQIQRVPYLCYVSVLFSAAWHHDPVRKRIITLAKTFLTETSFPDARLARVSSLALFDFSCRSPQEYFDKQNAIREAFLDWACSRQSKKLYLTTKK